MKNEDKNQQRQKDMIELNMLDMQLKQMEQQAMMIEQQIVEQQTIEFNLEELKKAVKGSSMLFPLSKDIFVEGKIESNDKVMINIGSRVIAKKSIDEAKAIVEKQKLRLLEASTDLQNNMREVFDRISQLEHELTCENPEHHH